MRTDPFERVLRGLYSAALYLLLPITVYHLIWRGFRQAEYFRRWPERYGMYGSPVDDDAPRETLWVHAVSVGEVNAAAPLVNALRRLHPDLPLLVTTITPTGSARVRALWGEDVQHVYLPYDLPGAVRRFFTHFRPRAGLVLETELWPNLLFGAREQGVPTYILNARLSERSLRGYRLLAPLVGRALRTVRRVGAQSKADAERFVQLGAREEQVQDLGNLKFDTPVPDNLAAFVAQFRERLGTRNAWIAASTHDGEEAAVVAMHRALRATHPELLLVWAPRHPERFRAAVDHAHAAGWRVATRRLTRWPGADDDVFVVDTLGELMAFYACAQVAFVGGSLQPIGGHNLLEPAAVGTAMVTGPHLHNFTEIAHRLEQAGAVRIVPDAGAATVAIGELLDDEAARARMVAAGYRLVEEGRGALARTLGLIAPVLPAG
ncbi:3-deoxy-D-manno-octulosonic acid transferase [Lysobacter helvus]|uniref:3-deoxy-D-manno-octulosonic acid transferase n=2 Tax=Lysobacteraceae TaxID=32033 RepID=A0ABN6FT63_9GAMM|nr:MULTISPECIES: lipid IV(A) 3-deoxy-D-manno-octulosonic acid transferase [Lysobacter]BCT92649.1 3-deoxy-D-manno-octulosonic acid transferase [Lysobacter caseinilyticus]BCT95802.1 3-deoxy-D-manno-octulosonic acid transferase [Lysobacter helvus]